MSSIATTWAATVVRAGVLAAVLTGISSVQAVAGSASDDGASGITVRASMKAYTGYEWHLLNYGFDNSLNPGNQLLSAPSSTWLEDLRPVVKVESEAGISAIAKPRLLVTGNWVNQQQVPGAQSATSYNQSFSFEWIEAYAKWQVNENLTVSAGTQNIQWGPGELFSPSNEIFPFFLQNGTPLFYLRGRNLFQAAWTPSKNSSVVLLSEYAPNNDPAFQAGAAFYKKVLLKADTSFTTRDGANSHTLSGIIGTDENRATWLGENANFTVSDAVSLYVDASENFRMTAFYPNTIAVPGSIVLTSPETSDTGLFPRVLVGGRYTFPKGTELRIEYLYNGLGWTSAQYAQALASLTDPTYGAQNTARFIAPGLDFRGQHYAYASLRIGDLGHQDKATFFFRYLQNLTDKSSSAIVSVEYTPADRWSLLGAVLAELGPSNTELTQIENGEVQTALRLDF
jgi:hypothetical protein